MFNFFNPKIKEVYCCQVSDLCLMQSPKFGASLCQTEDDKVNANGLPDGFTCQLPDQSVWTVKGAAWVRLSVAKLAIGILAIVAITPLPSPAESTQYIPSYQEELLQLETALQACTTAKCVGMYHAQIDRINAIVEANLPDAVSMATQTGEGEGQAAAQATVKEGK